MLIDRIDATDLTPFRFQGWTGKRLTTSFGWSYDFEAGRPTDAPPIPDWLRPFRDRAAAFAELDPEDLIQALLIRYDPGAGIGWHRDRPIYGHVLGISLGEPAAMRFRRRRPGGFDRASVPLAPRAAYHISGPAGTNGSTASSKWKGRDGQSRSAALRVGHDGFLDYSATHTAHS